MTPDDAALRDTLARWLEGRLDDVTAVEITSVERPASGYSAETLILPTKVRRGDAESDERFVLRRETPDPAVYPVQAPALDVEVWIQHAVMDALHRHSKVPLAPLVGYESDPSVLGAPFFVMGYVAGQVPIENPPYTQEGFFADASPDERTRMIDDGLRVLAGVHAVDWRAAGLDWLVAPGTTPAAKAQVAIWEAYAERELADRVHPPLQKAFEWLHAHDAPEHAPGLCWGDPRPGNIIWRDFRPACATDFEAASIAPPEIDLGWWLMFDRCSHEVVGVDRLDGEPSREEQRARYAAHAERELGDTYHWELFAAARYCAIVVRVMNRLVDRGDLPADQTIWIENPAVDCLVQLLEG